MFAQYSGTLSDPGETPTSGSAQPALPAGEAGGEADAGSEDRREPHRLRRSVIGGYKRQDVDAALAGRDEQIGELRRDIAALWLAYGQHERLIRAMVQRLDQPPSTPPPPSAPERTSAAAADRRREAPARTESASAAEGDATVGEQLADLDEVLAAIQRATATLERTYAEEIVEDEASRDEAPSLPEEDEARGEEKA